MGGANQDERREHGLSRSFIATTAAGRSINPVPRIPLKNAMPVLATGEYDRTAKELFSLQWLERWRALLISLAIFPVVGHYCSYKRHYISTVSNEPYGWPAPNVEKPKPEAAMTAFAKSSQLGGWCRRAFGSWTRLSRN